MRGYLLLMLLLLVSSLSIGQPPRQFTYQGRIAISGKPFNGTGQFKFALLDTAGKIVWASGNLASHTGMPNGTVRLSVVDGIYAVTLGDTRLGMRPVDASLLDRTDLRLRIWFNDGVHGLAQVTPDQPISVVTASAPTVSGSAGSDPQYAEILAELRSIRQLLEKQTAPQPSTMPSTVAAIAGKQVTLPLKNSYTLGKPDAPVTLVEFTDYQCPFCKQFFDVTFPLLKTNYIDTGQVRFISRYLPRPYHLQAVPAARAALCAGEQGKYWEMRATLFRNNTALLPDDLMRYARDLGLDMDKYSASFNSTKYQDAINADSVDAAAVGIGGTPSFVLGQTGGKDALVGEVIVGAKSYAEFEAAIKKVLVECQGGVCQ